jgi:hypothetical protein
MWSARLISLVEAGELHLPAVEPALRVPARARAHDEHTPRAAPPPPPPAPPRSPLPALSGRWRTWRQQHSAGGWWSWRRAWHRMTGTAAARSATSGYSPDVPSKPGYAQAAQATAAAEREARLLESWIDVATRHILGALGSHGLVELGLDQPSDELR